MRVLAIMTAVLLAGFLVGCEEGEAIDIDPGTSTDIALVVTTPNPGTAGDTVSVRATITVEGEVVAGVDVTFTAVNQNQETRPPSLSPVQTSILGFADTDFATLRADRTLTITATTGSASNSVQAMLDPAP